MMKWLVLAAGMFLFFNGVMSRIYDYRDPAKYCFNMDYIHVFGCFGSPVLPAVITWGAAAIGAALIIWSVIHGRRQKI